MMFRDVLHFCLKISVKSIFDIKLTPFRRRMEVIWETFCYFWELWVVLFCMLSFGVRFLGLSQSGDCIFGDPGLTRETASPAKDRGVDTRNEISRIR